MYGLNFPATDSTVVKDRTQTKLRRISVLHKYCHYGKTIQYFSMKFSGNCRYVLW